MTFAVRFHETGEPDVLQLEDTTVGDPGPGELKVRIEAIGLNRAEVMFRRGQYLETPSLPAAIGYEGAATVIECGAGVEAFSPGEAVCIIPAFSMNDYGIYAEEAIVPGYAVVKRPAGLSTTEAAAIWMQYLTAWGALVDIGQLQADQTLLIPAASSSVGIAAIQIANQLGAKPVALTRTEAKKAKLLEVGAADVIVTEKESIPTRVEAMTNGRGADMVFDPVGGPALNDLAEACGPYAQIFVYGALSPEATPFPLLPALSKGLTLRGYTLFEFIRNADKLAQAVSFIENGLEQGSLKPTIAKTFALADIVAAHRYLESNQQFGKVVVTV
jgi:NADPH:quinone reductase-like Zn-dependent oxidoreductase